MIDTAMLAAMRDAIEQMLPDTCTILSVTYTPDGRGGQTETWGTAAANVPCRLDLVTRDLNEMVKGGAVNPYPQYMMSFPYDTTLAVENRIVHGGLTYAVVKVNTSQSWKAVGRAVLELV